MSSLHIVHLSVLLYAICYMAQAPLLPYLTKHLGADDASYGRLQSAFSALQFLGGLLSGPFVDRYGGKVLLLTSYISSAACYAITAAADSMALLYLSRVTTLMQHAVLAARTIITAQTTEAERAAQLGFIGAAYGIGFALGPALGGQLSTYSLQAAAWLAAGASLLGAGAIAVLLPSDQPCHPPNSSTKPTSSATTVSSSSGSSKGLTLGSIGRVLVHPGVPQLLMFKALSGLCLAILSSCFTLVLKNTFHLSSKGSGWVLSYIGACMVLAQALLIKPIQARLGEEGAVTCGCAAMALSFFGQALARDLWQLLVAVPPLICAGTIVATVNTAQLTKAVPSSMAGTVVAVDMSLGSAVRMGSPILGTEALSRFGFSASCVSLGCVLLLLACQQMVATRERAGVPQAPLHEQKEKVNKTA